MFIKIITTIVCILLFQTISISQVFDSENSSIRLTDINRKIENKFILWLHKEEFEKTIEYEARLKGRAQIVFDSICFAVIKDAVYKTFTETLYFKILEYNADSEYFRIKIGYDSIQWIDTMKVSIKLAPEFKNEFKLDINEIEFRNLGVYKNKIFPEFIITKDEETKSVFKFKLPILKFDDYKVSTSTLKLKSQYFDSLQFSLFYYQKKLNSAELFIGQRKVNSIVNYSVDTVIYSEVDIPAEYPGGIASWNKYLERNLNSNAPVDNGAPAGRYTVVLSFIVDKTGNNSEINAENDPGYGTKEEAIRVLKKGGGWKPAVQNGRNVNSRQKVSVTFFVAPE